MELLLSRTDLLYFVKRQLNFFLPDQYELKGNDVKKAYDMALERLENCFKYITVSGYHKDDNVFFSHLHSDQYSQFLYFFSNTLWGLSENKVLCDKLIVLNKILNGMFFSYKTQLPDIFYIDHPVGTIIGNAKYSDFLVICQNVTIETNYDMQGNPAPFLGKGLFLGSGAKIIGNKSIGDRVSLGADVLIFNREIPADSVVFKDASGQINIKTRSKRARAQVYFNVDIE